jgi:hypothetical protein
MEIDVNIYSQVMRESCFESVIPHGDELAENVIQFRNSKSRYSGNRSYIASTALHFCEGVRQCQKRKKETIREEL